MNIFNVVLPITIALLVFIALYTDSNRVFHLRSRKFNTSFLVLGMFLLPLLVLFKIAPRYDLVANVFLEIIILYFVLTMFHIGETTFIYTIALILFTIMAILALLNFLKVAEYFAILFYMALAVGLIKDLFYDRIFETKHDQ